MASLLGDLALGLRQAAGVLNPQVQQETFQDDARSRLLAESFVKDSVLQRQQFELQQATPQAALQRQQLENEVGFRRAVADAGGDQDKIASAAMQFGKPEVAVSIVNAKEKRLADAQAKRDTLEQHMRELQMRLEDKAATREQQGQYQQMMVALRQQALALQSQVAQSNLDLKSLRLELMGKNATDKAAAEEEKKNAKSTQQLGVALERANIPQTDAVVKDAERAVANPDVLPYLSGPRSAIPDMLASKDVTDARQAISKLFNITLKDRSGAAVTSQELERLKTEFGQGVFKSPEQLKTAIGKAREIIEAHGKGIAAGYGANALKSYNDNLKEVGGTPLLQGGASSPSGPTPPPGFKVDK